MKRLICLLLAQLPILLQAGPQVIGYDRFSDGAVLYSELGCANCHGGSDVEIPRSGPSFSNLANRIDYKWTVEFLKNPAAGHKGSTMPQLTHGLDDGEIAAIASYLGTIQAGKALKAARHANAEQGSSLYHEKGCIACHAPTSDFRSPHGNVASFDATQSIPFPDLKQKYSLTSFDHFLTNVSKYRFFLQPRN